MPTLRETAYHEAGHAVVAVYFGLEVIEATIIEADGTLGVVSRSALPYDDQPDWRSRSRLVRQAIVCSYSGIEAERLINLDAGEDFAQAKGRPPGDRGTRANVGGRRGPRSSGP